MHEFSISLPEEADSVKIGTDGKATITTFFKQSVYSHGNCVLHHRYLLRCSKIDGRWYDRSYASIILNTSAPNESSCRMCGLCEGWLCRKTIHYSFRE